MRNPDFEQRGQQPHYQPGHPSYPDSHQNNFGEVHNLSYTRPHYNPESIKDHKHLNTQYYEGPNKQIPRDNQSLYDAWSSQNRQGQGQPSLPYEFQQPAGQEWNPQRQGVYSRALPQQPEFLSKKSQMYSDRSFPEAHWMEQRDTRQVLPNEFSDGYQHRAQTYSKLTFPFKQLIKFN